MRQTSSQISWKSRRLISHRQHLLSQIKDKSVLIRIDNRAAISYIHHQGGTNNSSLLREVEPIFIWAEGNLKDLRVVYLPAHLNTDADHLSQGFLDPNKWSLQPKLFSWIVGQWTFPELHPFATASNTKLRRFISHLPHPWAEAIDALSSPWACNLI